MNDAGVALGVNMLPSRLCDPRRPGLNSLLLIRDCIQHCAFQRVRCGPDQGGSARRVVAVSRGGRGRAGLRRRSRASGSAPGSRFPYFDHIPGFYRRLLPGMPYIMAHAGTVQDPCPFEWVSSCGAATTPFPSVISQDWNPGLWRAFDRSWLSILKDLLADIFGGVKGIFGRRMSALWGQWKEDIRTLGAGAPWSNDMFGETGFINPTWKDRNCPGPFYYAPQRERRPDVLIATNHCISPEMRMTSMSEWIALLTSANANEIQWRYDELNHEILTALAGCAGGHRCRGRLGSHQFSPARREVSICFTIPAAGRTGELSRSTAASRCASYRRSASRACSATMETSR